ncbi:MAG: prepilin-type N-terminal cleavage/methylation domain-containing protein [Patescibacteria group bacterium]
MNIYFLNFENKKGFSLVELTVSIAIFSMIIISTGGIFIQIFKAQKEMLARQILIDEGRYIMESMMKDIRMGYQFMPLENNKTRLNFTRYNKKNSFYCRSDKNGVCNQTGTYLTKMECLKEETKEECFANDGQLISSEKVGIKNLEFYINKTNQPYVTVILVLEPKIYRGTKASLKLQNTVSQRCPKTSDACAEE